MRLDEALLDALSARAAASPRLRVHFDLRDREEDGSMRMLNALEPGTVIPVHRHRETSEDVVCLRGCVEEVVYDDDGRELERWRLSPCSGVMACHVPKGQYHTCVPLESGSVILEFKNGKYDPRSTEDLL